MTKYFGTDGVRGIANQELSPELAFKLGRYGGYVLMQHAEIEEGERARVIVGRDTRISGEMLEKTLVAGLLSVGVEVMEVGVIPTPAIAYLTVNQEAVAGIMISASHNPVQDNGIKFFGADGFKLSDDQEAEIEALLNQAEDHLPRPCAADLGVVDEFPEAAIKYTQYLQTTIDEDLRGLTVCVDAANGATAPLVNQLFADLDVDFYTMGDRPNGININEGVGSTHPQALAQLVKDKQAMMGVAFDGDGDRVIAVDENGRIIDGDRIMFICAKYLHDRGRLTEETVVTTVMSNIGFHRGLEALGIKTKVTQVGDRYVVEELVKSGASLGGEQSGHIVFMDYNTTGDGMLTALQLMAILKKTGQPLSELADQVTIYPQELVNVRVSDKQTVMDHPAVQAVIKEVEDQLQASGGRLLVRPSGTEALLRVMVEAPTQEEVHQAVHRVADVIRQHCGVEA